jgi:hypothetical protein
VIEPQKGLVKETSFEQRMRSGSGLSQQKLPRAFPVGEMREQEQERNDTKDDAADFTLALHSCQ